MIEVFRQYPNTIPPVTKVSTWDFINRGIKENIRIVEGYYKNNVKPVRSDHFLVKLLQSIPVDKSLPLYKYYNSVDSIALNHGMVHKLTSSIYKGSIQRGTFYGGIIPEVIIATDELFNIEDVDKNWKNICAVKPLLHPKSDMKYFLPNGVEYSSEFGLAVLLINIPMLALQYRAFYLNELRIRPNSPYGTAYFVAAYVLPNMVKDNTEIAMFNRLYNAAYGIKDRDDIRVRHPFATINYLPHIDHFISRTLENIDKSDKSLRTVFSTIPAIYKENLYEQCIMPELYETQQVSWALMVTRLKMIDFLIKVGGEETKSRNMQILSQTVKALRMFSCYTMIGQQLPLDAYFTQDEYIENILRTTGGQI